MPIIMYTQTFQRQTEVEVSVEEYAVLHQTNNIEQRHQVEQDVLDRALSQIGDDVPYEFLYGTATDELDEEVFEIDG